MNGYLGQFLFKTYSLLTPSAFRVEQGTFLPSESMLCHWLPHWFCLLFLKLFCNDSHDLSVSTLIGRTALKCRYSFWKFLCEGFLLHPWYSVSHWLLDSISKLWCLLHVLLVSGHPSPHLLNSSSWKVWPRYCSKVRVHAKLNIDVASENTELTVRFLLLLLLLFCNVIIQKGTFDYYKRSNTR